MHLNLTEFLKTGPVIALVGASNNKSKFGNIILRDLIQKKFEVIPVNSRDTKIEGLISYPDLSEAGKSRNIELVVYVVPPSVTLKSLEEAHALGLKKVWIQPGAGDERVREFLDENDFEYLMNACVMVEAR